MIAVLAAAALASASPPPAATPAPPSTPPHEQAVMAVQRAAPPPVRDAGEGLSAAEADKLYSLYLSRIGQPPDHGGRSFEPAGSQIPSP